MRKAIAFLLVLIISFVYCSSGTVVLAEENGEKLVETEKKSEEKYVY